MIDKPVDLFGEPIMGMDPLPPGEKGKRKPTKPRGFAAPPGSGPKGETCRGCDHYCRVGGGSRHYPKCGLVRAKWTHGPGSDIRAGAAACLHWKKAES